MASAPITSWQTEGEKVEIVTYFLFLGSQIIVDSDWNHEINMFTSWEESYNKTRQHIKKSRNTILPTEVCVVKVMVFPFSGSHV